MTFFVRDSNLIQKKCIEEIKSSRFQSPFHNARSNFYNEQFPRLKRIILIVPIWSKTFFFLSISSMDIIDYAITRAMYHLTAKCNLS